MLEDGRLIDPHGDADKVDDPIELNPTRRDHPAILEGDDCDQVHWRAGERFHHLFEQKLDGFDGKDASTSRAVEYPDENFSFADMEALANQIARFLEAKGAKPGQRIGLLFDRSIFAYASVLAVSKMGGAFVPLDAGFPSERIAFILDDSEASFVLTLSTHSTLFSATDLPVLSLDAEREEIERQSAARQSGSAVARPDDELSYIIYTSGTTGRPKGVQVRHSSICNFLRVAVSNYGFAKDDRVYQSLTIAFDYSFEEIWAPLLSGSCLVPAPPEVNLIGADLSEFLIANRISAFCCVPTVLATLDTDLPDVRLLIVSGEACAPDLVKRWWSKDRRFLNLYGPTEATVSATWKVIGKDDEVTIGGPLPTYTALILDADAPKVLKTGEAGELTIGGIGVADGYLNRPDETARAFVEDFVGCKANTTEKLYRTGDLARINQAGEIEYLGRIDTQVKIRGYRIELEEIEAALREVSGLSAVVVNPFEPEPGVKELVAYYVADGSDKPDPKTIHDAVRSKLPPYMMPSFFEELQNLPLLPSSKVDRNKLPQPSSARLTVSGDAFVEPMAGMETELADILASVLKVERVSASADFFNDLGANSLTMARYLSTARKKLGIKSITMKLVYQHPTIRELAEAIEPSSAPAEEVVEAAPLSQIVESTASLDPTLAKPPERPRDELASPSATELQTEQQRDAASPQVEQHVASSFAYVSCAIVQVAFLVSLTFAGGIGAIAGFKWIMSSSGVLELYLRSIGAGVGLFAAMSALLIGVKWAAVGRFKQGAIPLWSLAYARFWIAQTAIRANPLNAFAGTPVYNLFLRALGAKVGTGSLIYARAPGCTDLICVGDHTLIRQDCIVTGYTAKAGYIWPGTINIGSRSYVGDATVLEINSRVGDDAQLGTTSSLHEGGEVPDGKIYQGSPAVPSNTNFVRAKPFDLASWRGWLYAAGQFAFGSLVATPFAFIVSFLIVDFGFSSQGAATGAASLASTLASLGTLSVGLYAAGIVAALLSVITLPKLFNLFFEKDKVHPLFGLQYYLARAITASSNSTMLQSLFGDSSLIVHYFKAVGYDLSNCTQNGSNFGVEQRHHSPFLCKFNRNTLVSDGLVMVNMDMSASSFKMSGIEVPPDAYLGNDVFYPVGSKVGENCLIATKAMIPVDGPKRDNVGILGSPPFEIPRAVARDGRFEHYKQPGIFEQRLSMKLKSNLITLGLFMFRNCSALFLNLLFFYWVYAAFQGAIQSSNVAAAAILAVTAMLSLILTAAYFIAYERGANWYRPMKPRICSLYERPFWDHERFWKMNINYLLLTFDGTPLKTFFVRLQGAKLGKQVFDNGASISEPHMVEIGDYTCLNFNATTQGHSLEDGTFKSDAIQIGSHCTIGTSGFLHYGVIMGDNAEVKADAFVMKGSGIGEGETWSGNPASQLEAELNQSLAA